MTRIPLLNDARLVVADTGEDDLILRPPPQRESLEDVGRAVLDAFAFPLAGEPLAKLVRPGGTATIVIEQPSLPIPSVSSGPRHVATATVADELVRLGVKQITILVAGGLSRRTNAQGDRRARPTGLPPPVQRAGERPRCRSARPRRPGAFRKRRPARQPGARRDRPGDHRHRRGDGPARRAGGAARGQRPRVVARCRSALAARDELVPRVEACRRDRAPVERARARHRGLARPERATTRWAVHRVSA